ncbi:uncharacterized protein LOC112055438 isoform X2 [Bicyclus anynana]|uniref:Uncharacterized protein LOC112055438 isoform X2 n=1 Tax=Bicyclus anynana TaxID=110368 RepID=A0ABM3LKX1_BICAN|nr:uncharacterized protein LOC112055438 isoform X2 [Bicyclus anynana]
MKRCCVPKCKTAINLRAVPYTDVTRWKKKNLIIGNQHAQWAFIERAYATDGAGGRARTIDLNDKHINPSSYDKMKVKYASDVFSFRGVHCLTLENEVIL